MNKGFKETYRTEKLSRTVHADSQYVWPRFLFCRRSSLFLSATLPFYQRISQHKVFDSKKSSCAGKRKRFVNYRTIVRMYIHSSGHAVARDRAQGATRDYGKETGTPRKGRVAQVSQLKCYLSGHLSDPPSQTGTWKADLLLRDLEETSKFACGLEVLEDCQNLVLMSPLYHGYPCSS